MNFVNQRDNFFKILFEKAKEDKRIIVITNDFGCESLDKFQSLEGQYYNVGPSEQLAITLASGMALEGKRPYVYGIIPFVSLRALEQIRVSICSMNLPVVIVGVGAGLSYDTAGLTHHGTEDLGIMRCLPNMTIANCSTIEMAEYYAKKSLEYNTPLYIRLDKKIIYDCEIIKDNTGYKFHRLMFDKKVIVTTGTIIHCLFWNTPKAMALVEVFKFPCLEDELQFLLKNNEIISVEEGYVVNGLGDYLLSLGLNVKKIGFDNFCNETPREKCWYELLNAAIK
jgi:transketolase